MPHYQIPGLAFLLLFAVAVVVFGALLVVVEIGTTRALEREEHRFDELLFSRIAHHDWVDD